MADFLLQNPSETIIVVPKCDNNDMNAFKNNWNSFYGINGGFTESNGNKKVYPWFKRSNDFPALGDVRGKLVLFSRESPPLEVPAPGAVIKVWNDNSKNAGIYPFQIQDWYRVGEDGVDKHIVIVDAMIRATSDHSNQYWLNFLSCIPNFPGDNGRPRDIAGKINTKHAQALSEFPLAEWEFL